MTSPGWQELVALGLVAFAAAVLLRKAFRKNPNAGSCCGRGRDAQQSPPSHRPIITPLHHINIERHPDR